MTRYLIILRALGVTYIAGVIVNMLGLVTGVISPASPVYQVVLWTVLLTGGTIVGVYMIMLRALGGKGK
jgi:hypothetical protein